MILALWGQVLSSWRIASSPKLWQNPCLCARYTPVTGTHLPALEVQNASHCPQYSIAGRILVSAPHTFAYVTYSTIVRFITCSNSL